MQLGYDYLHRAELWLLISILIYFIMNGAQIFETVVIIPKWSANAPASFQIFKGEYGIDLKTFWIAMHSVHEVTFIMAIAFCWQLHGFRNFMLMLFVLHFAVRVWTILYFAPNIIEFQKMANEGITAADLQQRVDRWKDLNYLRIGLFVAVSVALVFVYYGLLTVRF